MACFPLFVYFPYFFSYFVVLYMIQVKIQSSSLQPMCSIDTSINFAVEPNPTRTQYIGRLLFGQNIRKFRVRKRIEQSFCGIQFRNFGYTFRGWAKTPENRSKRKIPFHSTIPARVQFLRARKSNSTWLFIELLNIMYTKALSDKREMIDQVLDRIRKLVSYRNIAIKLRRCFKGAFSRCLATL